MEVDSEPWSQSPDAQASLLSTRMLVVRDGETVLLRTPLYSSPTANAHMAYIISYRAARRRVLQRECRRGVFGSVTVCRSCLHADAIDAIDAVPSIIFFAIVVLAESSTTPLSCCSRRACRCGRLHILTSRSE